MKKKIMMKKRSKMDFQTLKKNLIKDKKILIRQDKLKRKLTILKVPNQPLKMKLLMELPKKLPKK